MHRFFTDNPIKGLVLLFCLASINCVHAQSSPADANRLVVDYSDHRLSLDAVDATYESIFRMIAEKAGLNASLNGDLSARTTISYSNISVEYALQRLMQEGFALIVVRRKDETGQAPSRIVAFDLYGPERDQKSGTLAPPRVVAVTRHTVHATEDTADDRQQVQRLAGMIDRETIDQLADILQQSDDPAAREHAVLALADIPDDKAIAIVEQGLSDTEETVRITALNTLATKEKDNIDLILGQVMFGDRSASLRQRAVEILGNRGTEAAQAFLTAARKDPDVHVRAAATRLDNRLNDAEVD